MEEGLNCKRENAVLGILKDAFAPPFRIKLGCFIVAPAATRPQVRQMVNAAHANHFILI